MRKNIKRIIILLTAVFSIIGLPVFAQGDEPEYQGMGTYEYNVLKAEHEKKDDENEENSSGSGESESSGSGESSSSGSSTPSQPSQPSEPSQPSVPSAPSYPDPTENMSMEELNDIANNGSCSQKTEALNIIAKIEHKKENDRLESECGSLKTQVQTAADAEKENPAAPAEQEKPPATGKDPQIQNAQTEQKKQEDDKNTGTQENKKIIRQKEYEKNSEQAGDPVRITEGVYEQNETDIGFSQAQGFYIQRHYLSNNPVISSFGYGWSTNLDERIIKGLEADYENYQNALEQYSQNLSDIISEYESQVKQAYGLSNIFEGDQEYEERKNLSVQSLELQKELLVKSQNLLNEAQGYEAAESIEQLIQEQADSIDALEIKISEYETAIIEIQNHQKKLLSYKELYETSLATLLQNQRSYELSTQIHEHNKELMFQGLPLSYEETGLDSLILIDEQGYPYVFNQSPENSQLWQSSSKQFNCIRTGQNENSFRLIQNDGIIKEFDSSGFITRIWDRNENWVSIKRTGRKIEYIENSFGEHLDFVYEKGFIKQITNARDKSENVVYSYKGNFLEGVKDTDGDSMTMLYNSQGLLTQIIKPDKSTVTFSYDEITQDGKLLTTATINEEDYDEHFDYYRAQRKTVYTDHDKNRTIYEYDEKHRTIRQENPDGSYIIFHYNDKDELAFTNENGFIIHYSYDQTGRKTRSDYPDGSYESWTYDPFGALTTYCDRDQVQFTYVRDSHGNLTEYWQGNNLILKQVPDSRGLVKQSIIYSQNPIVIDYTYDDYGNVSGQICGGLEKKYLYDKRNRLKKVSQNGILLVEYEYNGRNVIEKKLNKLVTSYIINERKDLVEICQKDQLTGKIHKKRIEYDKRHLPLYLYYGDEKSEQLVASYLYSQEGKIEAQVLHGKECWVNLYNYKQGIINEIKQFKVNYSLQANQINKDYIQNLLKTAGKNVYIQKNNTDNYEKKETSDFIEYYSDGSIKSCFDDQGLISFYNYDKRRNISSLQNAARIVFYNYDKLDRLNTITVTAASEQSKTVYYETYDYSEDGRITTITKGGKYKNIYENDAFGNLVKETDGNGNTRYYEYDCLNHLIAEYDGYHNKTIYEYNALGKECKIVLPGGEKTEFFYNYMGLLEKVNDEVGLVYYAYYDQQGRLISEEKRADKTISYEYDKDGKLSKILYAGEIVESYSYNKENKLLTVRDGNNNDYLYFFNEEGRLISERNRKNLSRQYYYDQKGFITSQSDFDGSSMNVNYSADKRRKTVKYSDGLENTIVYDAIGGVVEAQNSYSKNFYQYDEGGYLIYQKDCITGHEIFFEYDMAGNRICLTTSNSQIYYRYGKNNEIKEIFDNIQKTGVKLDYNKNGQEILRKCENGTIEETLYDKAGRIIVKKQTSKQGVLLWAQGYIYAKDGKISACVDNNGLVTFYEYNKKGELVSVQYPYNPALAEKLKKEALQNGLAAEESLAQNRFLTAEERENLLPLLELMERGLSYSLSNLQIYINETYSYDKKGNRITKTNPFGTIEFNYDIENCLLSSGSNGNAYVTYTYDNTGNLITEQSGHKSVKYAYNSQNRLIYSQVIDNAEKTFSQTNYAYDAFGRRVLVKDLGQTAIRTVYDGFSFNMIKQAPSFENGLFTDLNQTSISWVTTGRPTGERYRYIDDVNDDGNRYFYLDNDSYSLVSRYRGSKNYLNVNGSVAALSSDEGNHYFTSDYLGSITNITDSYGYNLDTYTYDASGQLLKEENLASTDLAYLGKQYDFSTKFYNYGFRDYNPSTSRFITRDPLCDGYNWFSYAQNDPVNFVDLWGFFYYTKDGQKSSKTFKRTEVIITRQHDGLGNEFDSIRQIYKDGVLVYTDVVGANCSARYYDGNECFTEPDGIYYYTFEGLTPNGDGTYDSKNYHNVIRHKTDDPNIPEAVRKAINEYPGDFLDHANQKKEKDIYSTTNPWSAGCAIGQDGQEHQDEYMRFLMDGVEDPQKIRRIIKSINHCKGD